MKSKVFWPYRMTDLHAKISWSWKIPIKLALTFTSSWNTAKKVTLEHYWTVKQSQNTMLLFTSNKFWKDTAIWCLKTFYTETWNLITFWSAKMARSKSVILGTLVLEIKTPRTVWPDQKLMWDLRSTCHYKPWKRVYTVSKVIYGQLESCFMKCWLELLLGRLFLKISLDGKSSKSQFSKFCQKELAIFRDRFWNVVFKSTL